HDDNHAEVHDVAAVAARVAVDQLHNRGEHALAGVIGDDAAAAIELGGYGEGDQRGEENCHQRIEVADVLPGLEAEDRTPTLRRDHQENCDGDCANGGPQEIALQALDRSIAPS